MYIFTDRAGNIWGIEPAQPNEHPIHEGMAVWGWRVNITSKGGSKVTHQDPNLARAVAEAVAKADWLRRVDDEVEEHDGGEQSASKNNHIMLRCPHCAQTYEAVVGNNPLVKDGLTITPLPLSTELQVGGEQ